MEESLSEQDEDLARIQTLISWMEKGKAEKDEDVAKSQTVITRIGEG